MERQFPKMFGSGNQQNMSRQTIELYLMNNLFLGLTCRLACLRTQHKSSSLKSTKDICEEDLLINLHIDRNLLGLSPEKDVLLVAILRYNSPLLMLGMAGTILAISL